MTGDIQKAIDSLERVIEVCSTLIGFSEQFSADFNHDIRTQWAVGMGLIQIGEEINQVHRSILAEFDDQPWTAMIGMRNIAAHQYQDLSTSRVWKTLTQDLPPLRQYLMEIMLPELKKRN